MKLESFLSFSNFASSPGYLGLGLLLVAERVPQTSQLVKTYCCKVHSQPGLSAAKYLFNHTPNLTSRNDTTQKKQLKNQQDIALRGIRSPRACEVLETPKPPHCNCREAYSKFACSLHSTLALVEHARRKDVLSTPPFDFFHNFPQSILQDTVAAEKHSPKQLLIHLLSSFRLTPRLSTSAERNFSSTTKAKISKHPNSDIVTVENCSPTFALTKHARRDKVLFKYKNSLPC